MKTEEEKQKLLFDNSSIEEKKTNETITEVTEPVKPIVEETTTATTEPSATEATTEAANETTAATNTETVSTISENTKTTQHETTEPETTEVKEETRGRKKLPRDENGKIIREEKTQPVKLATGQDDLNNLLDGYKTKPETTTTTTTNNNLPAPLQPKLDASKFINGAVFLIVMDAVFPSLVLFLMEFMNPKYGRVKESARKKLKLDKEERELLEEGANEIVKYIFADTHPMLVFALSVGFIYYGKIDSLEDSDFHEPVKKKTLRKHE